MKSIVNDRSVYHQCLLVMLQNFQISTDEISAVVSKTFIEMLSAVDADVGASKRQIVGQSVKIYQ